MALHEDIDPLHTSKASIPAPTPKKKKNKNVKKEVINKNSLSVLRTTLRNNMELTSIADNKANVLLSLNALMLTFLVPLTIPYLDRIMALNLGIPLIILALTCLITIYIAVNVLKPGKFEGQGIKPAGADYNFSPFFFGNFHNMKKADFLEYSGDVLNDEFLVKSFISNDFYHIGLRLAQKMRMIRTAFNIFILGMSASIIVSLIMLIIYGR